MIISVVAHVDEIQSEQLQNKTVVVIDVFRSGSVIITALAQGAKAVIPTETVAAAKAAARPDRILAGERFGKKLEGFLLGNSPLEYTASVVRNKEIVLTTTNGTRALIKSSRGKHILIGSFLNASALCDKIGQLRQDLVLVCAGTRGGFSLEDGIAAGLFIDQLFQKKIPLTCDDLGIALWHSYLNMKDHLNEKLSLSQAGKRMLQAGLKEELRTCLQVDRYHHVPQFFQGKIITSR